MLKLVNRIIKEFLALTKVLRYFLTSKKKGVYFGCTGNNNLGDEVIYDEIKRLLSDSLCICNFPYYNKYIGARSRKLIKQTDYIILGGGTIIRKRANESYLRGLLQLTKQFPKAKILIIGPGVAEPDFANYIGFPIDIESWTKFLNKTKFLSVRGPRSVDLLKSWGIQNVYEFKDPAISLFRKTIKNKTKSKKIALNFADIGDRIYGRNPKVLIEKIYEFVEELVLNNWNIYLYPTTSSDLSYMLNVIGLKNFTNIQLFENYTDAEKSLDFLESIDLFVGQRLHGVIFSACVSTPFYALGYEPKIFDFLESVNLASLCTKVDEVEVSDVLNKIKDIYTNLDSNQNEIYKQMQIAFNHQNECVNMLKNIINEG